MAGQAVLTVNRLPADALGAAAGFHGEWVAQVRAAIAAGSAQVVVVLPTASADHSDWRRAAARDLARALAPARVNLLAQGSAAALDATLAYLQGAPGVTGHYLVLHDD